MLTLTEKLQNITSGLSYFLPELSIVGVLVVLTIGLFPTKKLSWVKLLTIIMLAVTITLTFLQWSVQESVSLFGSMLSVDKHTVFWKGLFDLAAILVITMQNPPAIRLVDKESEYYALILSLLLGAHLLVMSDDLLMVFLSIELISISSYILTAFVFNRSGMESGIKYLLFGAAASGMMIYGMSWLYALTGTLHYTDAHFIFMLVQAHQIPIVIASTLVLAGLLFKVSAVPMHIWAPDVYTAAPTPVVGLFSIVPKLAGFAVLIKWVLIIKLYGLSPVNWATFLGIISMLTITVGNFSALWQSNVKRLLAYSSIAHSGFLFIGLVAFTHVALQSLLFYAAVYLVMNIAAFMLVNHIERTYNIYSVEEYKGLSTKLPLVTVFMVIVMISLTGLPPTGGFTAKLLIFTSLWESFTATNNPWLVYLLIFGLINTVISLFYYLKIPYYMIFKDRGEDKQVNEKRFSVENFLSFLLVVALLLIFFKPDGLMRIINSVSFAF